jgi:hypothetical protein
MPEKEPPKPFRFDGVEHSEVTMIPVKGTRAEIFDDPKRKAEYFQDREAELSNLVQVFSEFVSQFNTLDLLWHAGWLEIVRVQKMTGIQTSNVAGHLRFLRETLLTRPLQDQGKVPTAADFNHALDLLEQAWSCRFELEMNSARSQQRGGEHDQREAAAYTSLIQSGETEVAFVETVWKRLSRTLEPFEDSHVKPVFGCRSSGLAKAFERMRKVLSQKIERARQAFPVLDEATGLPPIPASKEPNPLTNAGAMFCFDEEEIDGLLGEVNPVAFRKAFVASFGGSEPSLAFPSDETTVQQKPFAIVASGIYVLLDPLHAKFAPTYVLPHLFAKDEDRKRYYERRDDVLEEDAIEEIANAVRGNKTLKSYYVKDDQGNLCEQDGLIIRSGDAFVIECKAKQMRSFARTRGNAIKGLSDFKKGIQYGYDQCARVIRQLQSNSRLEIFDQHGNLKERIAGIKSCFPIVVLEKSVKSIGTDLKPWLELDERVGYPWVTDLDTMRVIFSCLNGYRRLTRFLRWRTKLHGTVFNEDEACFAGYFLCHGASSFPPEGRVGLAPDYSDHFDEEYFRRKGYRVPRTAFDPTPTLTTMVRDKEWLQVGVATLKSK